ncbi:MAG: efflux RND transporter periplasmic adaptor subunit, partial [Planctomycetaceae bacterium]|nr:efflux RND transporter periplasmic adaptor subunit [Planctomycetaceae bacterium]
MKKKILSSLIMLAVVVAVSAITYRMVLKPDDESAAVGNNQTADATTVPHVHLTEAKRGSIEIQTAVATREMVQVSNTVPGRLQYDDRRHVEIRVATPGIVTAVHVRPGEFVDAGTLLLELSSPEIGGARADVLKRESEVALAKEQFEWQSTICTGIEQLNKAVEQRVPLQEIRTTFRSVTLGESRDAVLTTYSQLLLADSLLQSAEENVASGVVPARVLQERTAERDSAEATLTGTLEQLKFDAKRRCRQAETELADAERRLSIARHHVRTLLGMSQPDAAVAPNTDAEDQLSKVEVRAPFAGTIERRSYSVAERVDIGDSLFVLADTTTLWVAADL